MPTFRSEFEIFPQLPPENTGGWDEVQLLSVRLKSWLQLWWLQACASAFLVWARTCLLRANSPTVSAVPNSEINSLLAPEQK